MATKENYFLCFALHGLEFRNYVNFFPDLGLTTGVVHAKEN